jgi:hypothetical protein
MGIVFSAVVEYFAAAGAAEVAGAGVAEAAVGAGAAEAIGGAAIVDATAAGYGGLTAAGAASLGGGASVAGGAAVGAAGASIGSVLAGAAGSEVGKAAISAAVGNGVAGMLAPKQPQAPQLAAAAPAQRPELTKVPTAMPVMPDPLAQQQARERSIVDVISRRGRSSTILTDSGSGKLGG